VQHLRTEEERTRKPGDTDRTHPSSLDLRSRATVAAATNATPTMRSNATDHAVARGAAMAGRAASTTSSPTATLLATNATFANDAPFDRNSHDGILQSLQRRRDVVTRMCSTRDA
jgi:hypothetical protein